MVMGARHTNLPPCQPANQPNATLPLCQAANLSTYQPPTCQPQAELVAKKVVEVLKHHNDDEAAAERERGGGNGKQLFTDPSTSGSNSGFDEMAEARKQITALTEQLAEATALLKKHGIPFRDA